MTTFLVSLVSPKNILFSGELDQVDLPGRTGRADAPIDRRIVLVRAGKCDQAGAACAPGDVGNLAQVAVGVLHECPAGIATRRMGGPRKLVYSTAGYTG